MSRPMGEKLTPKSEKSDEDEEDWMKLYKNFHDQSKLDNSPGMQWNEGTKYLKLGPTPDFRSDETKVGKAYYRPMGNSDITKQPH